MGLLQGRKGLVFGIANDRSIAWYVAKAALEANARYLAAELGARGI